ncbi:MAG: hypothetical protein M0P71_13765 [Melioribacteraceae bacterium]|nr:hypothetical protein [Melioribacteraceae bacterium]
MTTNTTIIDVPKPRFGINEIVYIRESALNGYLEPHKVALTYFDPDIGKYWYSFKFKKSIPVTQTVGDIIDLKTKNQIQILEDDLCTYSEALIIKRNFLISELNKTNTAIGNIDGGPEINVYGSDKNITDGDLTPNFDDFTNFGEQPVNVDPSSGLMRVFEVRNLGNSDLILTGQPTVKLEGDNDFLIVTQPLNILNPKLSSPFRIAFKPLSIGRKTSTVIIASNDANESIFSFMIEGQGVLP